MASFNSVHLIGRLTRDPETRSFPNGGSVVSFAVAINERKRQPDGTWGESAIFLDCKSFVSQDGKGVGKIISQYLRKGSLAFLDGKLTVEEWVDKQTGDKRRAVKVIVYGVQMIGPKAESRPTQTQDDYSDQGGGQQPESFDDIPF